MPPKPWLKGHPGAWVIALYIQPGASKTEPVGEHGDALKIRISAPPVDGKANEALLRWLSERLGCPVRSLELVSGQTQRLKRVRVSLDIAESKLVQCLEV